MVTFSLNTVFVLALASMGLVYSMRGQGAVGGWLVVVPPLFLAGGGLFSMTARGRLDWAGPRPLLYVSLLGFLVALAVTLCSAMNSSDSWWDIRAMLPPVIMLLACLLAVNGGSLAGELRQVVVWVLGASAASGFALILVGMLMYADSVIKQEQAAVARNVAWQKEQAAEFHAIPHNAPLWHYFRFMFAADESVRTECRALLAARADLDEKLIEYLGGEMLYMDALRYIGRIYENPPAAKLAPAYAQFLERKLVYYRQNRGESWTTGDRMKHDMREWFEPAPLLRKAGGNVEPQLKAWREYLQTVGGMEEMAAYCAK